MDKRELTGEWFLKRNLFGNYKVMVEVRVEIWHDPSYGNGCGSYAPLRIEYQIASGLDLIELGIKCV